jgi:hypothetical protein
MILNKLVWELSVFLSLGLISCKQDLKLVFPDSMKKMETSIIHEHEVIIYIDGRECTVCSLSHLDTWKLYENSLIKYNTGIILVVFTANEQNVIDILKSMKINFPVIFDNREEFRIMNAEIFQAVHDGVFVIDKNKNVAFTGSPIVTEEKWNSFMKLVKK